MKFQNKIIIFYLAICIIGFAQSANNDFSGRWCWDKDDEESAFSISIVKIGKNLYKGGYDAVILGGKRIDDNGQAFKFHSSLKSVKIRFKSGNSESYGAVHLKLYDNKTLEWTILKVPSKGVFYAPEYARLHLRKL